MSDHEVTRRRWWARLVRPLFLSIVCLTALELAGRWYLTRVLDKGTQRKFRFNSYRVYEHVPGYREGPQPDGSYRMTINGQGFRRRTEVERTKPAGVYRIFLLGGSAAHGVSSTKPFPVKHLSDTETIDAVLERTLNTDNDTLRFEVINAAVTGYQVFQHTAYLQSELLDLDPDMVLFMDGANDHYANNADMRYMDDFRFQFWKERLQEPSFAGAIAYLCNWLARYSALFKAIVAWQLQHDAQARREHVDFVTDFATAEERIAAHRAIATRQFLRSMHLNLDLLQRTGVDAVLCLQPMLVVRPDSDRSEEEIALHWTDENVRVLYPVVRDEVARVAREHRVPFTDLNEAARSTEARGRSFFIDDCHLTALGASLCAARIAGVVRTRLRPAAVPDSVFLHPEGEQVR